MSFINFESAKEKERIREELREAREVLLAKAQKNAEQRREANIKLELRGEKNWLHPSVANKLEKLEKKSKKSKKSKKKQKKKKSKSKSSKKKKRKYTSSSSNDESSENDSSSDSSSSNDRQISKKCKNKKRKHKRSESLESSDEDDQRQVDITKQTDRPAVMQREDWMLGGDGFKMNTFTRERTEKKPNEAKPFETYDPAKSARELNPYWKSTGTGLPSFQKPRADSDEEMDVKRKKLCGDNKKTNWRKPTTEESRGRYSMQQRQHSPSPSSNTSSSESGADDNNVEFLTDQQMNELGAKVVKAEIMGKTALALELKDKLEKAQKLRQSYKEGRQKSVTDPVSTKSKRNTEQHILLTHTDAVGNSRPLPTSSTSSDRRGDSRKKQKRAETHVNGERVRYFPEDDKYDIKQMFEREKYTSASDSNLQFANIASKHKNRNDDLDEIFCDSIRKTSSENNEEKKNMDRAMREHQKLSVQLENCDKCFDSEKMDKRSIVSMGAKVYLALPNHVGLQTGHCLIIPTQHVSCCTQVDEDLWEEINAFRKALTQMFSAQKQDVIFFEIANKLHKRPHLSIHCVPIPRDVGEMAPFYFKKAIEESEQEWNVNKQLISLKTKNLRSSIPKGLPYFWVHFGMDSGFAHVIEDEYRFPHNYAQEIIGGMLNLDVNKWRRPQKEYNIIPKVQKFADLWKKYDCTQ